MTNRKGWAIAPAAHRSGGLRPEPPAAAQPCGRSSHIAVWALAYRHGDRCPGCSRAHWHIGRIMAECAFCCTALPLAEAA